MTAQRAQVSRRLAAESPHEMWNAFIDLVSSKPSEPFSLEQRAAALVFWYEAEVENGGHLQYFSNRGVEEAAETIDALRELGAVSHAAILESALASVPSDLDLSPVSVEEYVGIALEDPHGRFDRAFHDAQPSLHAVLEAYLESHLSAFISFDECEQPNSALQRTRSAPLRSPLSFKTFGAAVKFRAGAGRVGERGPAEHRPCVPLPIPASTAGPMGSTHALVP